MNNDISNFNTENVVFMNEMFFCCYSLDYLDISNLTISPKCTDKNMFAECSEELWNAVKKQNNNLEYKPFEEVY